MTKIRTQIKWLNFVYVAENTERGWDIHMAQVSQPCDVLLPVGGKWIAILSVGLESNEDDKGKPCWVGIACHFSIEAEVRNTP